MQSLRLTPDAAGLDALVGRRASTGFRRVIDESVDVTARFPRLPPARRGPCRHAGIADTRWRTHVNATTSSIEGIKLQGTQPRLQVPDLCAGFHVGGTMEASLDEQGHPPILNGPVALSVETHRMTSWGWHRFDPLPAHGMRRRRRIDVFGERARPRRRVLPRQSHGRRGRRDRGARIHGRDNRRSARRCTSSPATPRRACCRGSSVPRPRRVPAGSRACPSRALRPEVRARFVGPSTCTHLNDVLRGLEDVEWLVRRARAERRP